MNKSYLYAVHAPAQTIALTVAGKDGAPETRHVTLNPGKPAAMPEDHKVTRALIAARYLTEEVEEGEESLPDPAIILPEGHPDRIAAIAAMAPKMSGGDLTKDGAPKVSAMSDRLGYDVTAAEIREAVEMNIEEQTHA